MSFHGRVSGTRIKRALGVQAALEWALTQSRISVREGSCAMTPR